MKNLVVAIDDLHSTDRESPIVQQAATLANAFGARVWLVHVVPGTGRGSFDVPQGALRAQVSSELWEEHAAMQALAGCLRQMGVDTKARLVEGPIAERLLEEAERVDAEVILLGFHRHSLIYRAVLGVTGERLISRSRRPILLVPDAG